MRLQDDVQKLDAKAAMVSGLAAGAAFVAVLEADLRLTSRNVDDLVVLGRPFVADAKHARIVGGVVHAVNSVGLAGLYALLERRIAGPPWLKGVVFANVENLILYPITYFEDFHPAVRDGLVDRYFNWPAFWQSVPRHIVYGAVLGAFYERLRSTHDMSGRPSPSRLMLRQSAFQGRRFRNRSRPGAVLFAGFVRPSR